MKIATVVGARPQFVKAAVVSFALQRSPGASEILIHTGQHYDANMSDIFFEELGLPQPAFHLGVGSAPHGAQTGAMLTRLEQVIADIAPDWVLIYGDTNSTLAAALIAAKACIPLAHVEAGLRSFNRAMPEEINRIVADRLSDLLFAPTRTSVENLLREGTEPARIHRVGDVMFDAALTFGALARERSTILQNLRAQRGGYVLATVHRAENTNDPMRLAAILTALERLTSRVQVILPLHPRTRALVTPGSFRNIQFTEPVGYIDMLQLEQNARLIVTDSGGVQKEAFFQRVPCVTVRTETEWLELVDAGWNRVVPPLSGDAIYAELVRALDAAPPSEHPADLFGGGNAASAIVERLLSRD